jgi:hypothetical protein
MRLIFCALESVIAGTSTYSCWIIWVSRTFRLMLRTCISHLLVLQHTAAGSSESVVEPRDWHCALMQALHQLF